MHGSPARTASAREELEEQGMIPFEEPEEIHVTPEQLEAAHLTPEQMEALGLSPEQLEAPPLPPLTPEQLASAHLTPPQMEALGLSPERLEELRLPSPERLPPSPLAAEGGLVPQDVPAVRISSPYRAGVRRPDSQPPYMPATSPGAAGVVLTTGGSPPAVVTVPSDGGIPVVDLGDPSATTAPELAERLRIAEEAAAAGAEAQRQYDADRAAQEAAHIAALEAERERIRQLEAELKAVTETAEQEKLDRMAAELARLEQERQDTAAREASYRQELADIKNLLQDRGAEQRAWRDTDEERLQEKETRYTQKLERLQRVEELLNSILTDQQGAREKAEQDAAGRPTLESVLQQLKDQAAQQRDLLTQMQETWRADADQRQFQTLEAVRETANQQIPFNVQTYLNDFSKALAAEVRMLLSEVGKLREERRSLQYEIGELLVLKAKHGPGGIFQPDFPLPDNKPAAPTPAPPAPEPTPPPPPAPAGWHRVHAKASGPRRGKKKEEAPAPPAAAPPPSAPASWITWQPNPMLGQPGPPPTAPSTTATARVPGLFGPRSPNRKDGDLP
ncbi:hypothetical protein CALCODRAFT_485514 [Calocera cornea HHB12733]|uniref:Uncharacterized protein n=1 Tax=Calocera cornea HHB12733 TaxID=1353952 RepID=A0A165EB45_9BASI|nr:hypothetical protein CALCODRAFT_485514 [Calocera cornea HHB12733]